MMPAPDSGFRASAQLIKRMLGRKLQDGRDAGEGALGVRGEGHIPSEALSFKFHPVYEQICDRRLMTSAYGYANRTLRPTWWLCNSNPFLT